MNYLEISILFLFIGFLVLFYVTNLIYNKCMKEKAKHDTKEPFDAMARKYAAQAAALRRAQQEQANMLSQAKAAAGAQAANQKAKQLRDAARAKNKAMQATWDSTRNDKFSKYNEYIKSIRESAADTNVRSSRIRRIATKYDAPAGSRFSNSTPVQLKTLGDKMKQFYSFNKGRDASILDISDRMTKVNNILGQAASGETITA